MKSYWHKPTGVCVSEAFVLHEVAQGTYPREDFEEAMEFGATTPLSDCSGIIELPAPGHRRVARQWRDLQGG